MSTARGTLYHAADAQVQLRADVALPPGVAGRIVGVALTYEVADSYRTIFARGCAKRSIDSKVAARKVPLLMDHDGRTGAHVGVVASMQDTGDVLTMTADVFDTPDGRAALDYVKTVIAAGASTGLSIGFVPRRSEMVPMANGQMAERFTEIELKEVSVTPMPAVPGAEITGARHEHGVARTDAVSFTITVRDDETLLTTAAKAALDALPAPAREAVLAQYRHILPAQTLAAAVAEATPLATSVSSMTPASTMADRLAAVRASYRATTHTL
jgi:HK97 family phage prohead protease